jgi:hypothetical protein
MLYSLFFILLLYFYIRYSFLHYSFRTFALLIIYMIYILYVYIGAAGEAPLHEEAGACVLMHVGVAQVNTRL